MTYVVAGGGGGSSRDDDPGGRGAQISGTIPVVPGETLTVWAGQGGQSSRYPEFGDATLTGGQGYGSGGNTTTIGSGAPSGTRWNYGASGGGASAILRGTDPLVVAGGGGGAGGWAIFYTVFPTTPHPYGGDAAQDGTRAQLRSGNAELIASPGASGTSGAGGTDETTTGTSGAPAYSNGASAAGRDGGDGGVAHWVDWASLTTRTIGAGGGGGGGGYSGGGGGQTASAILNSNVRGAIGGGGGGGTSFISPSVTGTVGYSSVATNTTARPSGFVTLSWG